MQVIFNKIDNIDNVECDILANILKLKEKYNSKILFYKYNENNEQLDFFDNFKTIEELKNNITSNNGYIFGFKICNNTPIKIIFYEINKESDIFLNFEGELKEEIQKN